MFADLIFMWGLNIPIGYLAGLRWGWSPFWVFVCLKLDTICKSFLCLWRLVQGRWIKNVNETTWISGGAHHAAASSSAGAEPRTDPL